MSSYFPEEIIINIFLRSPAKCVLRSRCVCRTWYKLFKNPNFMNMHLHHHATENNKNTSFMLNDFNKISSIEDDSLSHASLSDAAVEIEYPLKHAGYHHVKIEGTCNGLICLSLYSYYKDSVLLLWNPCTGEYKEIPVPCQGSKSKTDHKLSDFLKQMSQSLNITYGFAYDCLIDDYKLLRIEPLFMPFSVLRVFTLGSNSWRRVRNINYHKFMGQPGIFLNRAFHWTATRSNSTSKSILSFDVGEENVKELPKPKHLDDEVSISLGLLEGCLCIVTHTEKFSIDVWVMKELGVEESWNKLFSVTELPITVFTVRQLRFYKGDIVLEKNETELLVYNPKHEKTTIGKIRRQEKYHSTIWTYVGSLVTLNSSTYIGQDQEETKESFQRRKKKLKMTNLIGGE